MMNGCYLLAWSTQNDWKSIKASWELLQDQSIFFFFTQVQWTSLDYSIHCLVEQNEKKSSLSLIKEVLEHCVYPCGFICLGLSVLNANVTN